MSITERFIKIMQAELNDWLGYSEDTEKEEVAEESKRRSFQRSDKGFHAKKQGRKKYKNNRTQSREHFRYKNQDKSYQQEEYQYTYEEPQTNYIDPEQKYYDALEIQKGASFEEIKLAYKRVMKKYHPDRFTSEPTKQKVAVELCQRINEAYEYFKMKFGK